PTRFLLLVYRMPARPTSHRVTVWRQLKKTGAVYLQQSVCVFPDEPGLRRDLAPILGRIEEASGEYHLLPVRHLDAEEEGKVRSQFTAQAAKHYDEIIENCEVNFVKEIEFEIFRRNLTYEEAEEIRAEFEKIVSWFARVEARDWFGAPNKVTARDWIERCEALLEDFEGRVYAAQEGREVEGLNVLTGLADPPPDDASA
ncbi:MAG: Chromate resistance protein ChrB, partial [Candidatus Dormibacteraceae bacterium]